MSTSDPGHIPGWLLSGSHASDYTIGVDPHERREGARVAFLRCSVAQPAGFGTLMQRLAPTEYRGKRVRFAAWVRVEGVTGWAGLWMRVDAELGRVPLAFDNMDDRPIGGTRVWERHEVVLYVAPNAAAVAFGVLLSGAGEVRVASLSLEEVGADVLVTRPGPPEKPQNLDFEG